VEAWEGDQVDCKLPEIRIQLTREAQAACDTTHGCGDKVVEITNCTTKTRLNEMPTRSAKHMHVQKQADYDSGMQFLAYKIDNIN